MHTLTALPWWRDNPDPTRLCAAFYAVTGRPITPHGRTWINMSCILPGHPDKRPSFGFNANTGAWCCHGCGRRGDLAGLVMELYGMGFREARTFLEGVN